VIRLPIGNDRRLDRLLGDADVVSEHGSDAAAEREVRRLMEPAQEPMPWEAE
jgi:hypothetical protein